MLPEAHYLEDNKGDIAEDVIESRRALINHTKLNLALEVERCHHRSWQDADEEPAIPSNFRYTHKHLKTNSECALAKG